MIMKSSLLHNFVFCFFAVIVSSFVLYGSMLDADAQDSYLVLIFVQTILRDSDGNLVSYLESSKFTDVDTQRLLKFLETEASEKDPVIVIGGQDFQVIRRVETITFDFQSVALEWSYGYHLRFGRRS